MSVQSDAECLAAFVRRRDEDAFRQLAQRHGQMVYCAARRQSRDDQTAEDISQGVFILLIRKAASIKPENLAGWLVKTTYLVACEARRSESRRVRRETIFASAGTKMSEENFGSETDSKWEEISPLLDKAICKLSERDRNAISLRYLQEKSIREVAAAMGVSEPAASKQVERALARLRKSFAAQGVSVSESRIGAAITSRANAGCPPGVIESIAIGALAAAHHAGAASSAALLAKGVILMTTAKKTAVAAAIILMLFTTSAAVFVAKSYVWNSNETTTASANQPAAPIATTVTEEPAAANRIRVGILLSEYTATGPYWKSNSRPYGWGDQFVPVKAMHDPSIELVPVIEPDSTGDRVLSRELATNFPGKKPLDASKLEDLQTLQVLVAEAAHNVPSNVQSAIRDAVRGGVGFLNRGFMTVTPGFNSVYSDLSGMNFVQYGWTPRPIECEIVGDNPLLGDLAGHPGKTMMIELAGPLGQLKGIPLIRVTNMNQVNARQPNRVQTGIGMYPFYLSQFGKGRTMTLAFSHYQVPAVLNSANHGRFYVHCAQWLAGRELD